jgi:hypothetical protein
LPPSPPHARRCVAPPCRSSGCRARGVRTAGFQR